MSAEEVLDVYNTWDDPPDARTLTNLRKLSNVLLSILPPADGRPDGLIDSPSDFDIHIECIPELAR